MSAEELRAKRRDLADQLEQALIMDDQTNIERLLRLLSWNRRELEAARRMRP